MDHICVIEENSDIDRPNSINKRRQKFPSRPLFPLTKSACFLSFIIAKPFILCRLRNCSSSSLLSHRGTLLTEDGSDDDVTEY